MSFIGFVLFLFLVLIAVLTWKLLRDYIEYVKFYRFMEAITEQENQETYFSCNGCFERIPEGANRYHCTECGDFDYCEPCFKQKGHGHYMVVETMRPAALQMKIKSQPSTAQTMVTAFRLYAKRYCFGRRLRDKATGKLDNKFTWKTFEETWQHISDFGSGLRQFVDPREFVGICSRNRYEYYVADYACMTHSIVGPIIPHAIDEAGFKSIVNSTEMKLIVCGIDTVEKVYNCLPHCPSVKTVIYIDDEVDSKKTLNFKFENVTVYNFSEIEAMGKTKQYSIVDTKPDDIFTLIYTSGSTGDPKGVMLLEKVWHSNLTNIYRLNDPDIVPSWSNSDRKNDWRQLMYGGRVGIFSGDINVLFEDVQVLRPTSISATPVFWNKIYSEYKKTYESLKLEYDEDYAREKALGQFTDILGDRVTNIVTGGAATSPEVLAFMKRCFKCSVDDSYGATEVGAITSGFRAKNFVDTKLVPWEEYSPEDKPFPRGELCVKSPYMSAGYYKNEEKTKEVFVDGWYHTGDIVEQVQDIYKIIDRKKNIFKLAQGEFVAPSRLENIFVESPLIDQIYVHGDALKSFLLAVVVPNEEVAQQWCKVHGKDGLTFDQICKDQVFIEEIHKDIIRIGAKNKMRNYEIPFGVILSTEKFTEANLMLNSNFKIVRHAIAKRFKPDLAQLYEEYENKQDSVQDKLLQILSSAIGIEGTDPDSKVNFKKAPLLHLGTDSLSAIKIQNMLKSNLNIEVPISVIVAEGANIEKLANYVNSPQVDPLDSFDLDKELEHSFFMLSPPHDGTSDANGVPVAKSGKVLLTGSCGFLGLQLLHDLLAEGKTVYCLLRKSKTLNGLDRIKERFAFAKFEWHEDFNSRVIPLDGDLALPLLGFENYLQLADEIEEVYHVAAYVNSVLPYFSLKKSNVEGTKHIVNFCLNGRSKLLHFVSTASVCVLPETRVEEMPVYRQGNSLYKLMGGYNLSKFVAERFIWKTVKEGDLKAVIYRPGMISSSTKTGYCNLDDFDNRLLVGLLQCKQVPTNVNASMESNPVDFVARTILTIAKQESSIGRVFNLVNPNKLQFDKQIKLLTEKVSDLQMVSYETWKNEVLPKLGEDNPIYPMVKEYFGRRSWFPARESIVDCANTEKILQQFNAKFVEVSDEVLNAWFDFVIEHIRNDTSSVTAHN